MGLFRPARVSDAETAKLVRNKLDWILEACAPVEVWLFGSAARGELNDASDIDIAIVFETTDEIESARRALYSSPRTDAWPHDLVFFTHSDLYARARVGGLPMVIVEDGIRIYPEETDR